jgi:hypothetical protein
VRLDLSGPATERQSCGASDLRQGLNLEQGEIVALDLAGARNALPEVRIERLGGSVELGFSKKLENLAAARFVVRLLQFRLSQPRAGREQELRAIPAMAAGVVRELWTVEDLFRAVS